MKGYTTLFLVVLAVLAAPAAYAATFNDTDILNFALNLECLEAEFYSCAAFGVGLNATLLGHSTTDNNATIGCAQANLTTDVQIYATEIANDEIAHVAFLRSALGSLAVPCPKLNIGSAFAAAGNAAAMGAGLTNGLNLTFTPYGYANLSTAVNSLLFLHGAFIFEDVGVTAYAGALQYFVNKNYLTAAAQIGGTESYHAGIIRTLLYEDVNTTTPFNGLTVGTLVGAIAALRQKAGGSPTVIDNGIGNGTVSQLVPVQANAMVGVRTPEQVLAIAYLTGNASQPGGFFPNGINGGIAVGATPAQTTAVCNGAGATTFGVLSVLVAAAVAAWM